MQPTRAGSTVTEGEAPPGLTSAEREGENHTVALPHVLPPSKHFDLWIKQFNCQVGISGSRLLWEVVVNNCILKTRVE